MPTTPIAPIFKAEEEITLEVWDSSQYTCLAQNSVGRQSLTIKLPSLETKL